MEHLKTNWKKYAILAVALVGMFWYKADLSELIRMLAPMVGLL